MTRFQEDQELIASLRAALAAAEQERDAAWAMWGDVMKPDDGLPRSMLIISRDADGIRSLRHRTKMAEAALAAERAEHAKTKERLTLAQASFMGSREDAKDYRTLYDAECRAHAQQRDVVARIQGERTTARNERAAAMQELNAERDRHAKTEAALAAEREQLTEAQMALRDARGWVSECWVSTRGDSLTVVSGGRTKAEMLARLDAALKDAQ